MNTKAEVRNTAPTQKPVRELSSDEIKAVYGGIRKKITTVPE